MNNEGFIKLSRKFFENPLWKEARVYSRAEAWLDLIQMARFDSSNESYKGRDLIVRRGEVMISRRYLEKRWNWGSTKVNNFLKMLLSNHMTNQKQTNGQTIITLINYELYNSSQTTKQTKNEPQNKPEEEKANHPEEKNKPNKKKDNKNNNIPPTPPKGEGINYKARLIFESHFRETFKDEYYWTAKDAGAMSGIIKKITYSREKKQLPVDDESLLSALKIFLSSIQEGWIYENFSAPNINSKFNEIVSSARKKNETNGRNKTSCSADSVPESRYGET